MDDFSSIEENYFPNISIPTFERDVFQGSLDSTYSSPMVNQDQDDILLPLPGIFLFVVVMI